MRYDSFIIHNPLFTVISIHQTVFRSLKPDFYLPHSQNQAPAQNKNKLTPENSPW